THLQLQIKPQNLTRNQHYTLSLQLVEAIGLDGHSIRPDRKKIERELAISGNLRRFRKASVFVDDYGVSASNRRVARVCNRSGDSRCIYLAMYRNGSQN